MWNLVEGVRASSCLEKVAQVVGMFPGSQSPLAQTTQRVSESWGMWVLFCSKIHESVHKALSAIVSTRRRLERGEKEEKRQKWRRSKEEWRGRIRWKEKN